jgi:hypothetical protein
MQMVIRMQKKDTQRKNRNGLRKEEEGENEQTSSEFNVIIVITPGNSPRL